MSKEMIVTATSLESRLAVLENGQVTQLFIEDKNHQGILGNIYKGKVTRVLPGMQAAFVDIGLDRNAFLYVADVFDDSGEVEEIVDGADTAAAPIVVDDDDDTDEQPKRGRRRRRGRRSRRPVAAEPPPEVVVKLPEWDLDILPERIQFFGQADGDDADDTEPQEEPGEILPLRFDVELSSSRQRRRRSARLTFDPDIHRLAAPESGGSEQQGKQSGSTSGSKGGKGRTRRRRGSRGRGRGKAQAGTSAQASSGNDNAGAEKASTSSKGESRSQSKSRSKSGARSGSRKTKSDSKSSKSGKNNKSGGSSRSRGKSQSQNRRRGRRNRNAEEGPRIGDLLDEGQQILVQVAKEPIGRKGARITSHIVLPGRYVVFMPTVDHVGVSRRIESAKERQRLRDVVTELRGGIPRGFIVRTAGEGRSEEDLRQDMVYLNRLWEQVRGGVDKAKAPAPIHQELDLVLRVIRDQFTNDFRALWVDDENEYNRIVEFINNFNPSLARKVKRYRKKRPIFDEYGVNSEIEKGLRSKVWLKNGGYLVINQTEALVSIDINTGKYVGSTTSLEETITKTNVDAVKEIVRQLRFRDLGGIIVIDFIDMAEASNRRKVLEALQAELDKDKSPSKMLPFNEFGLVAITRKRSRQSLQRTMCQPCEYCSGDGFTRSVRTMCVSIYEDVRRLKPNLAKGKSLQIRCHPDVAKALKTNEKSVMASIRDLAQRKITIQGDARLHIENFDLVEQDGGGGRSKRN